MRVADELSQAIGEPISATIIRDIEEERSAKWVSEYATWACEKWSEDTKPIFLSQQPNGSIRPQTEDWNRQPIMLETYHCDGFLSDHSRTDKHEQWFCPVVLQKDLSHYRAIAVSGNGLAPLFPHGSVLLFRSMSTPPLDSIVISDIESDLLIGHLTTVNRSFLLISFSGHKVEISSFKPFGAMIGIFQDYRSSAGTSASNICWNDEKTLVFPHDQFQGIIP